MNGEWLRKLMMALSIIPLMLKALESFAPDFTNLQSLTTSFGALKDQRKLAFTDDGRMLLWRGGPWPFVEMARELSESEDFGYSFDLTRLDDISSMCCGFDDGKQHYTGMIYFNPDGVLHVLNPEGLYDRTKLALKHGVQYHVSVAVCRAASRVTVEIDGVGKHVGTVALHPHLRFFRLNPQAPDGNRNAIGNFELHRLPSRMADHENAAAALEMEIVGPDGNVTKTSALSDGDFRKSVLFSEKTSLMVGFQHPVELAAIQLYGGSEDGMSSPKRLAVEGFVDGQWRILYYCSDAQDFAGIRCRHAEECVTIGMFTPTVVERARIRLDAAHGAGQVALREIEWLSTKKREQMVPLSDLLQMEFRLPVYRNPTEAKLTFVVSDHRQAPHEGVLSIIQEKGKLFQKRTIQLEKGRFDVTLTGLATLPAGRHMAVFETEHGTLKRLLRVERTSSEQGSSETRLVAGKKWMFTPDMYELADWDLVNVRVFPPEIHKIAQTPDEQYLIMTGNEFYQTADGRYCLTVTDFGYGGGMFSEKRQKRFFVSDKPDSGYMQVTEKPPVGKRVNPLRPFRPAAFPKAPQGTQFEFYDPQKHGKIALGDLNYVYSYESKDYGCVKAKPKTYWVTGRTADKKFVMMRKEPLFTDFGNYGEEDFDDGFMTNDNFGGIWLSFDGTECYWAQGQTVKRSPPYAVPYDNLQTGFRLMTVYSTRDGIDWQYRHCLELPSENDSEGAQHYGAKLMPLADANLMLAMLYNYDADAQQIYNELLYSRDGLHFHRFPRCKPFVRGKIGEWYYGHAFLGQQWVQDGNDWYQLANYCTPLPHFAHEVVMMHNKLKLVTADDLRLRFEKRQLATRWPHFKAVGGWEGLAELIRRSYYAVGVVKMRVDGWFGLCAYEPEGTFTTHKLRG
ncbi:MAG: hypothetical protein J6X49_03530, partial [Victivallales bacterium]|nr:hypothetical protein [Victivallales bacterium]